MTRPDDKEAARQAADILLDALRFDTEQLDNIVERLRTADMEEFRTRLLSEHALQLTEFLKRYPQFNDDYPGFKP